MYAMHRTIRSVAFALSATALLAIGSVLGWALAQPPAESAAGSLAERHADLHARYADARLRFAEASLRKAERLNVAVPGQISAADIRVLQARIDLLRDQVTASRDQPHGHGFAMQRKAAHLAVRLAEQDLADAEAVNNRQANTVRNDDVLLRRIDLEITKLRAEIWDDPTFLASPTDVLQMQVDQLVDRVDDLESLVVNALTIDRR
jgi:hypothetical protein